MLTHKYLCFYLTGINFIAQPSQIGQVFHFHLRTHVRTKSKHFGELETHVAVLSPNPREPQIVISRAN